MGGGGGKEGDTHSMKISPKLLNIVHENDLLKKYLINFGFIIIFFRIITQFHYPLLLNDIQV